MWETRDPTEHIQGWIFGANLRDSVAQVQPISVPTIGGISHGSIMILEQFWNPHYRVTFSVIVDYVVAADVLSYKK